MYLRPESLSKIPQAKISSPDNFDISKASIKEILCCDTISSLIFKFTVQKGQNFRRNFRQTHKSLRQLKLSITRSQFVQVMVRLHAAAYEFSPVFNFLTASCTEQCPKCDVCISSPKKRSVKFFRLVGLCKFPVKLYNLATSITYGWYKRKASRSPFKECPQRIASGGNNFSSIFCTSVNLVVTLLKNSKKRLKRSLTNVSKTTLRFSSTIEIRVNAYELCFVTHISQSTAKIGLFSSIGRYPFFLLGLNGL
uniref:Uncharacterized protein n=1 Tax=Romanomermis culicivorax TaxID=13658 RepID=A0A915K5D7_ROMCU